MRKEDKMKTFISMIIFLYGFSFAQKMNVHTNDGNVQQFNLVEIDSITFITPASIPTDGLLAYYPFNGNVNDESGNENNGTLLGGASVSDYLTIGRNNVDALSLPHTILNGLSDFTISAKLKISAVYSNHVYTWLTLATNSQIKRLAIEFENDNYPNSWVGWVMGANYIFQTSDALKDLEWHHVVFLRTDNIVRIYVDGAQFDDEITVNDQQLTVDEGGFIIGQHQDALGVFNNSNESWAGDMDNLRIYNRALSDQEILSLY